MKSIAAAISCPHFPYLFLQVLSSSDSPSQTFLSAGAAPNQFRARPVLIFENRSAALAILVILLVRLLRSWLYQSLRIDFSNWREVGPTLCFFLHQAFPWTTSPSKLRQSDTKEVALAAGCWNPPCQARSSPETAKFPDGLTLYHIIPIQWA